MDRNWHDCFNKKCAGNFDGICRQPYMKCRPHLTPNTKENEYYKKLLKSKNKELIGGES